MSTGIAAPDRKTFTFDGLGRLPPFLSMTQMQPRA
jgi:hypothetical protein